MKKHLRRLARWYLFRTFRAQLPYGERKRLDYWGATGNDSHHVLEYVEDKYDGR